MPFAQQQRGGFVGGGNNAFLQMQNHAAGSDTDTCASSLAARRISRDSLVSRGSLSDSLSLDQMMSGNLAMMMNQGMGGLRNSFSSGPQGQALNQSMRQLMMTGGMGLGGNSLSSMMQGNMLGAMGGNNMNSNAATVSQPARIWNS